MRLAAGETVSLFCAGRARTKGSLKPVHRRIGPGRCSVSLTESGQYAVPWKNAMIAAIRAQAACERFAGPVTVNATFVFERLARDADARFPIDKEYGDVDKLERNLLDALTQSGLILDDSLVMDALMRKVFVHQGMAAGVHVMVIPR